MKIKIKITVWDIKDIDGLNEEIVLYIIIYILKVVYPNEKIILV